MFKSIAQLIVAGTVIDMGEGSISVEARKRLVKAIETQLDTAYGQGKECALNTLFPEDNSSYSYESPLRDAAWQAVFKK